MKTASAVPAKHSRGPLGPKGGGGFGPIAGGGFGPIAGGGFGPIGGGGFGPIGGGPRSQKLLKKLAKQLVGLAKIFDTLAETPFGGVPKKADPTGGTGFGRDGGGGFGPIGGGTRSKNLLGKVNKQLTDVAATFATLAETPIGGVPKVKPPAKKK